MEEALDLNSKGLVATSSLVTTPAPRYEGLSSREKEEERKYY
jgi:hypothetical protein